MQQFQYDYLNYFFSEDLKDMDDFLILLRKTFESFYKKYDTELNVLSPNISMKYNEIEEQTKIPLKTCDPETALNDILPFFKNCINWNQAGTMFNVTPPVNMLSIALNVLTGILNPNLAEDRSCGCLAYAEQYVIKCLAKLLMWNQNETQGMSCFGGKATNFYAINMAIKGARVALQEKFDIKKAFYIISDKGHPCQEEVLLLQSFSKNNIITVSSDELGQMNLEEMKKIIESKISEGGIFLGITANAGTTMEYIVDDLERIVDIRNFIENKFNLPYRPRVHADSVLGWIWLFVEKIDKIKLNKAISKKAVSKIKNMYNKVKYLKCVDSVGIDFHKLGFVSYQSSFFLFKSLDAIIKKDMVFGELSPYKRTIELSRGAQGVISALTALKSFGYEGYINLIATLVNATEKIRYKFDQHPYVKVLGKDSLGICTVISLFPNKKIPESVLTENDILKIQQMNKDFLNFIIDKMEKKKVDLYFSISRSYVEPRSRIRYGGIKLYPMSPFLIGSRLDDIVEKFISNVDDFLKDYKMSKTNIKSLNTVQYHPIN